MASYTTSDLLSSIKTRAMIPTNQSTLTSARLLALANEEVSLGLLPLIMSTREEYYVTYKDYAANLSSYEIPTRAIGMKLRDVVAINAAGDERNIPQIDPSDKEFYPSSNNQPAFYLRNNKVIFTNPPTDSIRMYYYIRPSQLVETTAAAQVTSINTVTGAVDVSSLPATFLASTSVDFIKASPGYETLAMDVSISSTGPTTINFTASDLPSGLAIGDWIALAGESPVVQLPYELLPILAQRVAVKSLEALGDAQGMQLAQGKLQEMERAAFTLLEPRVDASPKKIIRRDSSLRNRYIVYGLD
jgi:hypothetical protein